MRNQTILFAIACGSIHAATPVTDPWTDIPSLKSALKAVQTQWIKDHPTPMDNSWAPAIYHIGAMEAWKKTKDAATLAYSKAWADKHNWGPFLRDKSGYYDNPDDMACGQAYADLLAAGAKPASPTAFEKNLDAVFTKHVTDRWSIVDYQFMSMPMWAKWAKIKKNTLYSDYILPLWTNNGDTRKLWDASNGLYYRDVNWIYPAKKAANGKPVFWSRGNGWAFEAHARALEELPTSSSVRKPLVDRYLKLSEGLRKAQSSDGFWRASLLDAADVPNPELSGTALNLAAIAWGMRQKILDKKVWEPIFNNGWKAIWTKAMPSTGKLGWCQDVGSSPAPTTATAQNDFCTGAFLLAGAEAISWQETKTLAVEQPGVSNTSQPRIILQGSQRLLETSESTRWALLDADGRTLYSGTGIGQITLPVPSSNKPLFLWWNSGTNQGAIPYPSAMRFR